MASTFIYFLLLIVTYSGSIETYFLSDYLDTNLPDRFSDDPIEENWQDKRSTGNEYSDISNRLPNNEESPYFNYRNGNIETEVDDGIEPADTIGKRKTEIGSDIDEVKHRHGKLWP